MMFISIIIILTNHVRSFVFQIVRIPSHHRYFIGITPQAESRRNFNESIAQRGYALVGIF